MGTILSQESLFRLPWRYALPLDLSGQELLNQRRLDKGGRDCVDQDAITGIGFQQALGQIYDSCLRSVVVRHKRVRLNAGFRCNVDDTSPFLLFHERQKSTRHAHRRKDVQIKDVDPVLVRQFLERGKATSATSVINQSVDGAKALDSLLCQALYLAGIHDIRRQCQRIATALSYLLNGLLEFLLIASVEHHAASLGCESNCNGFPDALAGPGYKDYLLFQSKFHRS